MHITDVHFSGSACWVGNLLSGAYQSYDPEIASQFDFLSKFLIIIRSPVLFCGTSSYLSLFCLECASFVLSAANMYVCHSFSKQVMSLSQGILVLVVKRLQAEVSIGHIQSIGYAGIPVNAH